MTETDWYGIAEAALLTTLRTLTDIFPNDYQVSDNEADRMRGGECFFIARPAGFPNAPLNTEEHLFQWQTTADLYVKYVEQAKSLRRFKEVRSKIINKIYTNPTLDKKSGVVRTAIDSNELVQYFKLSESSEVPNFVIQTLRLTITQRVRFNV